MKTKIDTLKEQLELVAQDSLFDTRDEFEASIKKFLACSNLSGSNVEFQYYDDPLNISRADIAVQFEAGEDFIYFTMEVSSTGVYL